MYDLAVIGAGYWGTAIALEARKRGYDTVVLDDQRPDSGSRNSSGIVHMDVFEQNWAKSLLPSDWTYQERLDSFDWLEENVGLEKDEEHWLNIYENRKADTLYRKAPVKLRHLVHMLPNNQSFLSLAEAHKVKVSSFHGLVKDWIVYGEGGGYWRAKNLVLACGMWTDELLKKMERPTVGVTGLKGVGALIKTPKSPTMTITTLWKPYMKYTSRPWGEYTRIGDTVERPTRRERFPDLLSVADELYDEYEFIQWMTGYRPVMKQFTVRELEPGLIVATGGYRAGLGVSGLVAKKALERIRT